MKKTTIIGIDLAKNIFHVCVMPEVGRVQQRIRLNRKQLFEWVICHSEGVIVMEACGGANHWAREFIKLGSQVKLIAPQYVVPYRRKNKNDWTERYQVGKHARCQCTSLKFQKSILVSFY